MPFGLVKQWDDDEGYGFITSSEGESVFVHYSDIQCDDHDYPSLAEGQEVEFETLDGPHGPKALYVRQPGQPARPAPSRRPRCCHSGVQRFFAESLRRIEYEVNDWADAKEVTVLSVSIIAIEGKGYGALVAYRRMNST